MPHDVLTLSLALSYTARIHDITAFLGKAIVLVLQSTYSLQCQNLGQLFPANTGSDQSITNITNM